MSDIATGFLKAVAYQDTRKNKKRGGVMNTHNNAYPERQDLGRKDLERKNLGQKGFCTEDILWALGIWAVTLGLSPVVVFYVLMVA